MTAEQAATVTPGSIVTYRGRRYLVASVRARGIAAPLFRLAPLDHDGPAEGLTSYRLCRHTGEHVSGSAAPPSPADIRAMMDRHGLSQSGLAALLEVEQSMVSRWLSGAIVPHPRNALALRRLMGQPEPAGHPLPSREQAIRDWRDAESSAAAWLATARAEGDQAGAGAAEQIVRLSRLTRQQLEMTT